MSHARRIGWVVALMAVLLVPATLAAKSRTSVPGYVDKQMFLDLLPNEDAIRVEVSIHKSLIKLICSGLEPPLDRIVCGLESIDSLVLDVGGETGERVGEMISDVDRRLQREGWERIVLVRESGEQVRVLVYNDDESILGLVVMVFGDREMVFVNIAGLIDLAAIQQLAGEFDIPGLEHLGDIEYEQRDKDN